MSLSVALFALIPACSPASSNGIKHPPSPSPSITPSPSCDREIGDITLNIRYEAGELRFYSLKRVDSVSLWTRGIDGYGYPTRLRSWTPIAVALPNGSLIPEQRRASDAMGGG